MVPKQASRCSQNSATSLSRGIGCSRRRPTCALATDVQSHEELGSACTKPPDVGGELFMSGGVLLAARRWPGSDCSRGCSVHCLGGTPGHLDHRAAAEARDRLTSARAGSTRTRRGPAREPLGPLWFLRKYPHRRVIIGSASDLAEENGPAVTCRKIMLRSTGRHLSP